MIEPWNFVIYVHIGDDLFSGHITSVECLHDLIP
jgi:hypothetical protein